MIKKSPKTLGHTVGPSIPVPPGPTPTRQVGPEPAALERVPVGPGAIWARKDAAEQALLSARAARAQACPTCGARVLVGLDSDVAGMVVSVDADPLDSHLAEVVARLAGGDTYALRLGRARTRAGWDLHYRSAWALTLPARDAVHLGHTCGPPEKPATDLGTVKQSLRSME